MRSFGETQFGSPLDCYRMTIGSIVLIGFLCLVGPKLVQASELVMFETESCHWCDAWDRDVGGIYHKTPEALVAPLRRVDIDAPRPDDLKTIRGVVYTPTFVVMDEGREIGRINGYPGSDHFWGLLGILLGKLNSSNN